MAITSPNWSKKKNKLVAFKNMHVYGYKKVGKLKPKKQKVNRFFLMGSENISLIILYNHNKYNEKFNIFEQKYNCFQEKITFLKKNITFF